MSRSSPRLLPPSKAKSGRARSIHGLSPQDANWDQRLGFLMHDVSRMRRNVFDEFMRPLKVTRSQWWVLAYLSRLDGMSQSDLADLLELRKAPLGNLIGRLEKNGLIRRINDVRDGRVKRVFLTKAGIHLVRQMRLLSHDMSERILEGLSLAERRTLANSLGRVKQNLIAISRGKH